MKITKRHIDALKSICLSHVLKVAKDNEEDVGKRAVNSYLKLECNVSTLSDVFETFVFSLQNGNMMPKVIKLVQLKKDFLLRYEPHAICKKYGNSSREFRFAAKKSNPDTNVNGVLWHRFSQGVLDGARWMSQFLNFADFNKYLKPFYDSGPSGVSLLAKTIGDGRIEGMRFALACDFIKDLGLPISHQLAKPDVHLEKTLKGLHLCSQQASPEEILDAIRYMARCGRTTPYIIDKFIWLANSGNLYDQNIRLWQTAQAPSHRKIIVRETLRKWRTFK